MTPVQRATIPLFMSNKDVCVEATTGSGKTLAFVIPVCEILNSRAAPLKKHHVGALVVGPTRELAMQIFSVFSEFTKAFSGMRCALFVGGTVVADNENDFLEHGAQVSSVYTISVI